MTNPTFGTFTVPASDDIANAEVVAAQRAAGDAAAAARPAAAEVKHDHEHPMTVLTADQITEAFVEWFYEVAIDGWAEDGPIEWEDAIDRAEDDDHDFGSQMDSPAILKLQREVRAIRRENGY